MRTQSVFWSEEKLSRVSELIAKGHSYAQVADVMSREFPNDVFTAEKIRHLKRKGKLSIPASRNLATGYKQSHSYHPDGFDMEDNLGKKIGENVEVLGNYAVLDYRGEENPKTLDELLKSCDVDTDIWKVDRYVVNKWETAMKTNDAIVHRPLFQVKAWLVRIKPVEVEFPHVVPIAPINFKKPKEKPKKLNKFKKALIIPDAQFGFRKDINTGVLDPFHDREALDCVLQVAELEKPDTIIYLGDMLSF